MCGGVAVHVVGVVECLHDGTLGLAGWPDGLAVHRGEPREDGEPAPAEVGGGGGVVLDDAVHVGAHAQGVGVDAGSGTGGASGVDAPLEASGVGADRKGDGVRELRRGDDLQAKAATSTVILG